MRDKQVWTMVWTLVLCLALLGAARAEVIGPALISRPSMDGASNYMFMHDDGTPGFTTPGIVTSWSFYNDNGAAQGGRTLEPVLLKKVGTSWVVTGVGQSVTTPATLSGVQTYPFNLVWGSDLVGPDYTFAHHDLGNPGSIESIWPGGNAETHRYLLRTSAKRPLGETIADASFSTRQRIYSVQFSSVGFGAPLTTMGDPLINRAANDGASGARFVLTDPFANSGRVIEWAFYDNDTPGRQITPLILELVGSSYFVRGIGTTRTTTTLGEQHVLFGLVSGVDEVLADSYYFAWKDGTPTVHNPGVIDWNDNGSSTDGIRYFGTGGVALGQNLGAGTFYGRDYSVQVTTFIPEPATLSLLGLGGLALLRRRRRKR